MTDNKEYDSHQVEMVDSNVRLLDVSLKYFEKKDEIELPLHSSNIRFSLQYDFRDFFANKSGFS